MPDRASPRGVPTGLWLLPLLCLLGACGGGGARLARTDAFLPGNASYPEPGPPGDPWRPYIRDASGRFQVPQAWIRAVMHQESGGHEYRNGQPILSSAGAMGLMQLMPATYAELQAQYGLGRDPFEPHDNILAGTGYISQMYRRYGSPGFLAAYDAGPQRLDDYLGRGRRLPNETIDYIAAISPHLGTEIAMSGPLAAYAGGGPVSEPAVQLAAYRPTRRVRPGRSCWHDPDAAYDPGRPCGSQPEAAIPTRPAVVLASATMPVPASYGNWAIQVGAYTSVDQARFAATMARQADFARLAGSQSVVQPVSARSGTLYRSRLAGLARDGAGQACAALEARSIPCMVVAPGG